MKHHIVRVVAVITAALMLLSIVPVAALQELSLPKLMSAIVGTNGDSSVQSDAASSDTTTTTEGKENAIQGDTVVDNDDYDIADEVVLGKEYTHEGIVYADGATATVDKDMVDKTLSPYEPYATELEDHPFLPYGTAWMDLSSVYYGAPATQNFPLTKWSANTSVYNITETGDTYTDTAYKSYGDKKYVFPDLDLIDGYLWVNSSADHRLKIPKTDKNGDFVLDDDQKIVYEEDVFEKGVAGLATKTAGGNAALKQRVKYDAVMLKADQIAALVKTETTETYEGVTYTLYTLTTEENGDVTYYGVTDEDGTTSYYTKRIPTEAFAYNRYDAMQGKYGITFDENVQSVMWSPSFMPDYYGEGLSLNNSILYLSDTPYLYFSTEGVDTTEIAISILIGAPVQKEVGTGTVGGTRVTNTGEYEYRWYTITDNALRPGVDAESQKYSMIPNVTISDVVATITATKDDFGNSAAEQQISHILNAAATIENGLDPVALAGGGDELYVDGSITGCIDFTNLLPVIMGSSDMGVDENGNLVPKDNATGNGSLDVQYKVAQIRVDTKTAATDTNGNEPADSAFRLNYLYFGPSLVTVFAPQNTVGSEVDGLAWQYAQGTTGIGDDKGEIDENTRLSSLKENNQANTTTDRAYTNGWENGDTVTLVNTPNDPQKIIVDTYGIGDGELIGYDEVPDDADFLKGCREHETEENATKRAWENSRVWKYTTADGQVHYLEAEFNVQDNNYYAMVTIPVRKWINVLGESRKLSLTATVLKYADPITDDDGNALTVVNEAGKTITVGTQKLKGTNDQYINPSFVLWGNEAGSLGAGHNQTAFGARFDHEDLLIVLGNAYTYYHVDCSDNYFSMEVDRTIGDSTIYNKEGGTTESWYDILRSPYLLKNTVINGSAMYGYGGERAGYTFVTALRFAMPVGSKLQVQNMKGDGNSAGLNTYSVAGDIVNAYDGGTGVQPNINVTSELPAYTADRKDDWQSGKYGKGDETHVYTQSGTIQGSQDASAAAYGPYLQSSYFTIYDLLDMEEINQDDGAENIIYGANYLSKANHTIYAAPSKSAQVYGLAYKDAYIPVFATYSDGTYTWGATGVKTASGTAELGWVELDNTTPADAAAKNRVLTITDSSVANNANAVINLLGDHWHLSNYFPQSSDYNRSESGYEQFHHHLPNMFDIYSAYGSNKWTDDNDVTHLDGYDHTMPMYGNMWRNDTWHNGVTTTVNNTLQSINSTELELRNNGTASNGYAISRTLENAVRLKRGATSGDYPVLYYDTSTTNDMSVALSVVRSTVTGYTSAGVETGSSYESSFLYAIGTHSTDSSAAILYSVPATWNSSTYFMNKGGCGYISFEPLMTGNDQKYWVPAEGKFIDAARLKERINAGESLSACYNYPKYVYDVTAVSVYAQQAAGTETRLNRLEIRQEKTGWLDDFFMENKKVTENGTTGDFFNTVGKAVKVYDSLNILNDAFFHYHDEANDNGSDEKTNSNQGWSGSIGIDYDGNGTTWMQGDENYAAHNATAVEGVYEYRTALGHLRVVVPGGTAGQVTLTADRSFNTKNYRYLYYSYSMRDVATGIAAEAQNTSGSRTVDGKGVSGVEVALKSTQGFSQKAYLEQNGTWVYYSTEDDYWEDYNNNTPATKDDDVTVDDRSYQTIMNAALDLSTLTKIDSLNQIVLYLNNAETEKAEFYINYIYLSNVPPEELHANALTEKQYQYYYMMDNTGDRYSARFPTLDNPSGQVTGDNSDNERVNPIKVERGKLLQEGHFFNGDPLYGYGNGSLGFDKDTGSEGYYEKNYGSSVEDSMRHILFYEGQVEESDDDVENENFDILDFYDYKNAEGGVGTVYDMKWSYGRWYTGKGESGLNTMYIANEDHPDFDDAVDTHNKLGGNLLRRYATENYVLLRAGIMPKKYLTYFDAKEGQMLYADSSEDITNGVIEHLNNYYIDENTVFSYFKAPRINTEIEDLNKPTRYGYKFVGWYRDDNADGAEGDGSAYRLYKYTKKAAPGQNYFYALWEEDESMAGVKHTLTIDNPATGKSFTRTMEKANNWQTILPTITQTDLSGKTMRVIGWREKGVEDGPIYMLGTEVTITRDITLEAVLLDITDPYNQDAYNFTHSVSLENATLHVWRGAYDENGMPIYSSTDAQHIGCYDDGEGSRTYYNIPHGAVLIAIPDNATSGWGWQIKLPAGAAVEAIDKSTTETAEEPTAQSLTPVCGVDHRYYKFSVLWDTQLNYTQLATVMDEESGTEVPAATLKPMVFTNAAQVTVNPKNPAGREMKFYTQFNVDHIAGANVVAYGTLYTKSGNFELISDKLDTYMRLNESSINAESIQLGSFTTPTSAVRQVCATFGAANSSNQFYLTVTENKGNEVTYYARGYVIYTLQKSETIDDASYRVFTDGTTTYYEADGVYYTMVNDALATTDVDSSALTAVTDYHIGYSDVVAASTVKNVTTTTATTTTTTVAA